MQLSIAGGCRQTRTIKTKKIFADFAGPSTMIDHFRRRRVGGLNFRAQRGSRNRWAYKPPTHYNRAHKPNLSLQLRDGIISIF
jgi:hypothetical protein